MEKPTGVIQKIIESLQQVNALDTYSPIEKDIILHNLRAAYMIFLNIRVDEQNEECRVEKLFEVCEEAEGSASATLCNRKQKAEGSDEEMIEEETSVVEEIDDEMMRQLDEEVIEVEPVVEEEIIEEIIEKEQPVEEEVIAEEEVFVEEKTLVAEIIEEETSVAEEMPVSEKPLVDDILEFIPDAKPYSSLLFDDMILPKPEKKSLNDLLTEKKDDNSLGAKFQQSYIPDLTKAIAINEKFTFIRELFQNSGNNFSNAIQKLNECDNIESAFALMEELKHQYLWDTTSSAYLSLCDLVRRRFVL
jgi:hypothetical protein